MKPAKASYLLIDISNTFTKYATATSHTLNPAKRVFTKQWNSKSCESLAKQMKLSQIVISSVVPSVNRYFKRSFPQAHFLSAKSPLGLRIGYPNPRQIGADRLANAVAVVAQKAAPAVVIDFGTAVTFDVIDKKNSYRGGVIAPGLQALTNYLHEKTALLPKVQLKLPRKAIGQSTKEAIQIGAFLGYQGLIQFILQAIRKEIKLSPKEKLTYFATGGDAKLLASSLRRNKLLDKLDPQLTLKGLHTVARQLWPIT